MTTPALDLTGTTCIWGQSESGKSYLASEMVKKARATAAGQKRQFVIIDPQARDGVSAPGVREALASGAEVIVCNDARKDHQIGAMVFALAHSTPDTPVYVVADEAPSYMDAPRDVLSKMVLQGRHAGFGLLIVGQRPSAVWAEYRTQAKRTYWLRLTDHTDTQVARKQLGQLADNLPSQQQGEFIQWPQ